MRIFDPAPLPHMQEESALISIALSDVLIARHFQTSHLGCNYAEEPKTDFCHRSGAAMLHHALTWDGAAAAMV